MSFLLTANDSNGTADLKLGGAAAFSRFLVRVFLVMASGTLVVEIAISKQTK